MNNADPSWVDQSHVKQAFVDLMRSQPASGRWWVAYSGGLDSTVLLYLTQRYFPDRAIQALHINHGLSPNADAWQAHCEAQCVAWGLPIQSVTLPWTIPDSNVEAAARQARYQAFEEQLGPSEWLLMGHHLDDQIETFFLRLMRGTGIDGLAGMPQHRPLGAGQLLRPLLGCTRAELEAVADAAGLAYLQDESNDSDQYDRNFLRNQVLPLLASRWPVYRKPLARTLKLLSEVSLSNQQQCSDQLSHLLTRDNGLKTPALAALSEQALFALLREWLLMVADVRPSMAQLVAIRDEALAAQPDAQPAIKLGAGHVRRFKSALYYTALMPEPPTAHVLLSECGTQELYGSGRLTLTARQAEDPRRPLVSETCWPLEVRFSVTEASVKPVGRAGSRDLKRLFQEYRVKPWLRCRMPLLYSNDRLVAVGDLFVVEGCQAKVGERGIDIQWSPIT